jgi:hypothetical protein
MLEKILNELPGRACEHEAVVTTRNHGLERQVCESCGHVTVRLLDTSGGEDAQLVGTVHHPRPSLANAIAAEGRHVAE